MNVIELEYFDENNKYGILIVNEERVGIGTSHFGKYSGFNPIYEYTVMLANSWNRSNPIRFHAKTLKSLMSKIKRHQYRLVR